MGSSLKCSILLLSLLVELEQLPPTPPSAEFLYQMNPPNLPLCKITKMLCGHIMQVLVKVGSCTANFRWETLYKPRACLVKACYVPAPESCCGQQGKVPQTSASGREWERPVLDRQLLRAAVQAAVQTRQVKKANCPFLYWTQWSLGKSFTKT